MKVTLQHLLSFFVLFMGHLAHAHVQKKNNKQTEFTEPCRIIYVVFWFLLVMRSGTGLGCAGHRLCERQTD